MICILHGYLLEGSGSNLWTRSVVRALCRAGETVHLVCQEPHPDAYDFIACARAYGPDGAVTTLFERGAATPGRCILHKPLLGDTLPVYVGDRYEEFSRVVPMVDLSDAEIEDYLARNVAAVTRVVQENRVTALHANHAVLMSVVAERVAAATGVPFAVMPHGSAIEYAVKRDQRFHAFARGAAGAAGRVFVVGDEMRRRVQDVFPGVTGLDGKLRDLPLGVDTSAFRPAAHGERADRIAALTAALDGLPRGKTASSSTEMRARFDATMEADDLAAAVAAARAYPEKRPDENAEEKLAAVDWAQDDLLLFVGRLIAAKGPQNIVAALPEILEARPRARLIVVGHGPLRALLEALLWALEHGERRLVETIVERGEALAGGADGPLAEVRCRFDALAAAGRLDAYFDTARRTIRPDRVLFLGYLTHRELVHLFPCCDVAVFPSVVAEAGPLVFLEALASGCFPLGTYFAGMGASIDSVAGALPAEAAALMKLRPQPEHSVADIAANAVRALALEGRCRDALRAAAVARYDWSSVARTLADELGALAKEGP